jgi:glycosyl-4,4'-diaponeurosporenoate acyltransferase
MQAAVTNRPQPSSRWRALALCSLVTVAFAVAVIMSARAGGRSVGFAFGINWLLMAWAITLGSVTPLRLPARYYAIRPFEKSGRVYDRIGVRWYRRLFRRMLWSVKPALLRSQPGARDTLIKATYDPETGHLFIFVVIAGITVWALASGWWDTAAWLLLFNLLHNGYPVLSMRQIRARLEAMARPARSGHV